jgi:hypothetical protein
MKSLQKRPEDRFQTAREMRAALREALESNAGSVRFKVPSSVPPPARRDSGRPPAPAPSSPKPPSVERTSSGAETIETQSSGAVPSVPRTSVKQTAVEPARTFSTEGTIDPEEASRAIKEARERLSGRPPAGSGERPVVQPQTETRTNPTTILIAVVATAIVVAALMMLMR